MSIDDLSLEPLRISVSEWELEFQETPPAIDGQALRGACLKAYRNMVCPPSRSGLECGRCSLLGECSYGQVFAARPLSFDRLKANATIPRPYIFFADQVRPGKFRLVLVGEAADLGMRLRRIFESIGREGLHPVGVQKAYPFRLKAVTPVFPGDGPHEVFASYPLNRCLEGRKISDRLELHFLTPTRVKNRGVFLSRPEPEAIIKRLRDRLNSLSSAWCGGALGWDFRAIGEAASQIRVLEEDIHETSEIRRSGSSRQRYRTGFFKGRVRWAGVPLALGRLLVAGEYLGVGKGAAFGDGRYRVFQSCEKIN